MVDQRGGRVQSGEDKKRVGEKLMHFHHAVRGGAIGRPRRSQMPDAEDWQRVAALELRDDADDRHRQEQRVEHVVTERRSDLPARPKRVGNSGGGRLAKRQRRRAASSARTNSPSAMWVANAESRATPCGKASMNCPSSQPAATQITVAQCDACATAP